jgi:hypothetical protein
MSISELEKELESILQEKSTIIDRFQKEMSKKEELLLEQNTQLE